MSSVPASVPLALVTALHGTARRAALRRPPGATSRGPRRRAFHALLQDLPWRSTGPVQRWPSPAVAPVQLHRKARCYTHTPWPLYHHEGGGGPLGPRGCQARSHFRAKRAFWHPTGIYAQAPRMPRHHGCPGPTDAHRPSSHRRSFALFYVSHTPTPRTPNGPTASQSDFTTAYSPSLQSPQQ
jgi:hypothetical protein